MTDRHTADTITDDALDALYKQADLAEQWRALAVRRRERVEEAEQRADTYQAAWHSARDRARKHARRAELADAVTGETKRLLQRRTTTLRERAERAEAAIARVRELAERWQASVRPGEPHPAAVAVLAALDEPGDD